MHLFIHILHRNRIIITGQRGFPLTTRTTLITSGQSHHITCITSHDLTQIKYVHNVLSWSVFTPQSVLGSTQATYTEYHRSSSVGMLGIKWKIISSTYINSCLHKKSIEAR